MLLKNYQERYRSCLRMGYSPSPNENFKEIKKNKDEIQTDINKKIEDEK